jgi:ABC-type nitrate/sulfonate/bicarbonate transport system substrate-binding protein
MRQVLTIAIIALAAWPAAGPGSASAEDSPRRIRVAFSSTVDLGDLPTLMAHARLAAQGYEVIATFYARAQLAADALARGQADIGNGSTRTYWAAVGKGADIATVMEQVGNGWAIVAAPGIRTCADLHERRFAITGDGSVSAALASAYLRDRCPGVEPRVVTIAGSEHRAAALLAGRIDAAPLELAESLYLGARAPGRFGTLVSFADALPFLVTTGIHVNRGWSQRHPRALHDYVGAVLATHRAIARRPDSLVREAQVRLRLEPALVERIVEAHIRANAWDPNGRLSLAAVRDSLAFFARSASLPASLTPERVADLGALERVLDEIGRR